MCIRFRDLVPRCSIIQTHGQPEQQKPKQMKACIGTRAGPWSLARPWASYSADVAVVPRAMEQDNKNARSTRATAAEPEQNMSVPLLVRVLAHGL